LPTSGSFIDYYGITFDHLVPADDTDPEVLQINIFEIEDDGGIYVNEVAVLRSTWRIMRAKRCLLCRDAVRKGRGARIG
jgi:hypothetical protein